MFGNRNCRMSGWLPLEDVESGEQVLLDTSERDLRSRYQEAARQEDDRILSLLRKCRPGLSP